MGETRAMSIRSATRSRPLHDRPASEDPAAMSHANADAVLAPSHGNASERAGRWFSDRSPILVFGLLVLSGYLLLAALAVGLGFLLVDVFLPIDAVGQADEAVPEWLASNRSSSLDDASYVASSIGDVPFIPGLVIVTALGAAILRRWRVAAFIVGAILVEVATYRVTSLIVHRERPDVPRMDQLPVDQSYPSGHVAASVVVYIGLALLITARLRNARAIALLWTVAIALPLIVAVSRMYRGMHHPLDASAGILIGLSSIAVALFATRAAVEAARVRSEGGRG
jgi:membrane-associated phospholipid phosphatase